MSGTRALAFAIALTAACAAAACGDPPEREMQQAQGAIDAARAAGADVYAHDEFAAAEDALKRSQQAVRDRDYREALNDALDARERAQTAAKEAADQKATARTDADRALASATTALDAARAKLATAEAAHAASKALAEPRAAIAAGTQAVQKARAAFDRGEYKAVTDALGRITPRLLAATRDLDAAAVPPVARKRR